MASSSKAGPPCPQVVVLSVIGSVGGITPLAVLEVCLLFLQKKKGHLAKVCQQKNKYRTEQTNAVTAEETMIESHQSEEYTLFKVSAGSKRPYKAVVKANGNLLPKEIDTRASVSVVREETRLSKEERRPWGSSRHQSDCQRTPERRYWFWDLLSYQLTTIIRLETYLSL